MNQENVSATSTSTVADTSDVRIKLSEILRDDKLRQQLISFVKLDFMTIKRYLSASYIWAYVVLISFVTIVTASLSSGISMGTTLALFWMVFPFEITEKAGLDVLYQTLSLDRATVVLGRYMFVAVLNAALCAAALLLGLFLQLLWCFMQLDLSFMNISRLVACAPALCIILAQAIVIPFFFKSEYSKHKNAVAIFNIMIYCSSVMVALATGGRTFLYDGIVINNGIAFLLGALISPLVMYISYRVSLKCYLPRDF